MAAIGNIGAAIITPVIKRFMTEKPQSSSGVPPPTPPREDDKKPQVSYPNNLEEAKKLYEKLSKEYGS
jgi:hypothetical protein